MRTPRGSVAIALLITGSCIRSVSLPAPSEGGFVSGRVDALKQTHARWFSELFGGDYGLEYYQSRHKIGLAHVRIGLRPFWVDAVMTVIRTELVHTLEQEEAAGRVEFESAMRAVIKLLDLDLAIINMS